MMLILCIRLFSSSFLILITLQVVSSDRLARILQKMLTVGNLMNEGTHNGGATGFTLDSLLKMVNTKGILNLYIIYYPR